MTTLTAVDVLALTLWGEGRGEPIEGRIAIACVIRNRLKDGRWGTSIEQVCRAPYQFSCWNAGDDANHRALMELVANIQQGRAALPPGDVFSECYWIADGALRQRFRDRVERATHYHVTTMNPRPAWARDEQPIAEVGHHLFYRGIA